jgi:PAS domain S-box-containing protein
MGGSEPTSRELQEQNEELRAQLARERELTVRLLKLANASSDLHGLMREATALLQGWTGCEAVGIRLREGEDFPYFETRGFPQDFVRLENSLCVSSIDGQRIGDCQGNVVLECMCGNVLCGRFDPSLPFFTPHGSFWTNSTAALLASTTEADRQARTRNRCNSEGYESVALVPLRSDGTTFGLLQLNDRRPGRFTREQIDLLEGLAAGLAEAIGRRQSAQGFRLSLQLLAAIRDAQLQFITETSSRAAFGALLETLVTMTDSEYGFIADVICREDGRLATRNLAISDISWDAASRQLFQQWAASNWEFPTVRNLIGATVTSGRLVISNAVSHDPRSGGTPPAHPPLRSFMGIPMYSRGELVGMAGVANRPGGYTEDLAEFLTPFIVTCAGIIQTVRGQEKEKEAARALRQSEEKYRRIVETANEGIWAIDPGQRTTYVNRQMASMLGYAPEEMLGRLMTDFMFSEDLADHNAQIEKRRQGADSQYERRFRRKDGSECWTHVSATGIRGSDGDFLGSFAMYVNVNRLKADEKRLSLMGQQLQHAVRLATLGELAAGIAHEVNQPLCAIVNYAKACGNASRHPTPDLAKIGEWSDSIAMAAARGGDVVRRLCGFARRTELRPCKIAIQQLVRDAALLVRFEAEARAVTLRTEMPQDDLLVVAQPVQIHQVLVNLLRNAIEAFGHCRPTGRRVVVDVRRLVDRVWISVEDNGPGLSETVSERLFEPFFTTKPEGLGLGLAISRTIVEEHGGQVLATSNHENGASFHFTLPIAKDALQDAFEQDGFRR